MLTALREHESVRKAMLIQSDEHATLELSGKLTHYRIARPGSKIKTRSKRRLSCFLAYASGFDGLAI
jgi:hypothetical protein